MELSISVYSNEQLCDVSNDMTSKSPTVSIGLPVYNGEDYISEAIESVLAQTYGDFELIISDNGSTDATQSICRSFVQKDSRVSYHQSVKNRGASWNYNRTFELSTGTYFRWLAADDKLAPTLIEESVKVLEENPDVILSFTWIQDIDQHGNEIEIKRSAVRSDDPDPVLRFQGLSTVRGSHNCEEVFGLIRRDVLAKTKLIDNYTDSDRTLLADLGLRGRFQEIASPLFLHRLHPQGSVTANPTRHDRSAWFDPRVATKLVFPNWRQLYELMLVIWAAPISNRERIRCYRVMFNWVKRRRNHLRHDLVWAGKRMFGYA